MADLEIRLDRRAFLYIAAAAVLAPVARLATESLTISTAYPAPSGVYNRLMTTSGAVLARDKGNAGIGTASPGAKLEVAGPVKIADGTQGPGKVLVCDDQGLASWGSAAGAMPSGAVAYFDLRSCPSGWSELAAARGRCLVALTAGGTAGGTVGTALGDLETRAVGRHNHDVSDPGHSHNYLNWNTPQSRRAVPMSVETESDLGSPKSTIPAFTGISINPPAGSVAGTNAPYIQLLACQKL